ncbi:SF1B family DNA helicase RecD2 [Flagellatimonas centrodinii]|uniref:SF1B family DNA helicase RecD2 n=1 Tax=Flagellatimonas centrodinii TaxID=2806210 RepID=UPI003F5028A0
MTGAVILNGEVTSVRFRSTSSGWSVLLVRESSSQRDIEVTGIAQGVEPGHSVEIEGEWVRGRGGGRQLKAKLIRRDLPVRIDGIERFLSGGHFKGVGPGRAKALVQAFGERTLTVIADDPARVAEVHGFSRELALKMRELLHPMRVRAPAMASLQEVVGPGTADGLISQFGGSAATIVHENPYRLCSEAKGFGFLRADEIARKSGMPADSPHRLAAGIGYLIDQAEGQGHAGLPDDYLYWRLAKITGVPASRARRISPVAELDGLVITATPSGCMVQKRHIHETEQAIADLLVAMANAPATAPPTSQVDGAIGRAERARRTVLDDRQRAAVRQAVTSMVSIVTGGPGTGKSATLGVLVGVLGRAQVAQAAPTGKAARRMQEATGHRAGTLHALLAFNPNTKRFGRNEDLPIDAPVVAVDEVSMLDIHLLLALLKALRPGQRLVLMGDPDQLPSIGVGNVLQDLIDCEVIPVTRLETVYRQGAGSAILANARRVIRGEMPDLEAGSQEFRFLEADNEEAALRLVMDQVSRVLPRHGMDLRRDIQMLTAMNKGMVGVEGLNREIQRLLPESPGVDLQEERACVGDRVLQTRTNHDLGLYNGDLGLVTEANAESKVLKVRFDGRTVTYGPERNQLRLAWAMTTHRVQGSEFSAVPMVFSQRMSMMLDRGLLYTAMTRARYELVIIAPKSLIRQAVSKKRVRHSGLVHKIREVAGAGNVAV